MVPGLLRPPPRQLEDPLEEGRECGPGVLLAHRGQDALRPRPVLLPEPPLECLPDLGETAGPVLARHDAGVVAAQPGLGANPGRGRRWRPQLPGERPGQDPVDCLLVAPRGLQLGPEIGQELRPRHLPPHLLETSQCGLDVTAGRVEHAPEPEHLLVEGRGGQHELHLRACRPEVPGAGLHPRKRRAPDHAVS